MPEPLIFPLACRIPIRQQLAYLLLLEDGWFDGDGVAYDPAAIDRAAPVLEFLVDVGIPTPYVYPTPDNEIRAEWSTPTHGISLTFDSAIEVARLHAVDLDGGSDGEHVEARSLMEFVDVCRRLLALLVEAGRPVAKA